jgi:FkbM family methyltransferase
MNDRARVQELLCSWAGIKLPYFSMGKVDSLNLFDPNELVIFDFYRRHKDRYKRALDIGANIGLHSILMREQGWRVFSYEPLPIHYARLRENLALNDFWDRNNAFNFAVSDHSGTARFVNVRDNSTGSHLAGYKDSYGEREYITVDLIDCRSLWPLADFAKIDVEGAEATLILTLTADNMEALDILAEVGNPHNAELIYKHLTSIDVPMYAQKIGWEMVKSLDDMPTHHSHGSLFISTRNKP